MSVCDEGWTTMVSTSARCTNQDLISTKHRSRSKGRNDGRIISLSHRTKGGYKNLPSPHYRKNRRLYRWKFPKLSGTKVQNVKSGVLGFWVVPIKTIYIQARAQDWAWARADWARAGWARADCVRTSRVPININSVSLSICQSVNDRAIPN